MFRRFIRNIIRKLVEFNQQRELVCAETGLQARGMMERSFDAAFQIFANQALEGLLRRQPALAAYMVKPVRSYGDMTDFIAQYDGQQGGGLVVARRAQALHHSRGDVEAACFK